MSAPRATGSDAVARAPAKDSRSDAADSSGAMAKRSGAMPRENMPARSPRPPLVRSAIGGVLMGLANLVPGVSGGTMILVVGLYDEFIAAVADVSRLRFTRRNTMFLAVVVAAAAAAIVSLAGTLGRAVEFHRAAMFSLFIGLTLGGAPSIIGRIRLRSASAILGVALGVGLMIAVAATNRRPDEGPTPRGHHQPTALDNEGGVVATYGRDVAAGALGASAMVLPGISGAYMLLILGRYEAVLMAIDLARDHATSGGTQGDAAEYLRILIPVAVGAVLAIVLLSNGLKWLLRRHEQGTCSVLLGILVGSVIGIWPFDRACRPGDYALGAALAAAGFTATLLLGRIGGASRGITPPV